MGADYHYISTWQLQAPIERVWAAISQLEQLPAWYPAVQQVQTLTAGDPDGVGTRVRYLLKGRLPMRLAFEATIARVDPPRELELQAEGDLAGRGRWELEQQGEVTTVRYLWDVQTTRPWMNLVAPVARPLFTWNSKGVMLQAGKAWPATCRSRWSRPSSAPRPGWQSDPSVGQSSEQRWSGCWPARRGRSASTADMPTTAHSPPNADGSCAEV
jgi:uncharacterized protein YndB with AHSA1/START domain